MLLTDLAILDDLLASHTAALGADFTAYRNHAYRVLNLCVSLTSMSTSREPAKLEKIAIACAFHDLAIWTDHTFDYLEPSRQLALRHLDREGKSSWEPEVGAMIMQHHKITAYEDQPEWLVEPFRKADWIDVTLGIRSFGVPRSLVRDISAAFPDAGFHARLLQLTLQRLRSHPLDPLPIFRW